MPCTPGCGACCDPVFLVDETVQNIYTRVGPLDRQGQWVADNWAPLGHTEAGVVRLACVNYDIENRSCTIYESRPPVCREFPFYGQKPSDEQMRAAQALVCGYQAELGRTVLPIVEVR